MIPRPVTALLVLLAGTAACSAVDSAPVSDKKPNILIILSDDQGYSDVGFQGCKDIPTPNLDALAASGVRCTSAYVTHPYCSPSRAALLTGRYQARFGHEHNPKYNPEDHQEGLPLSETTLSEILKKNGYATGWIGKWHLGAAPEFLPQNRGFQETFGFISGMHHYLDWVPDPKNEHLLPIQKNGSSVDVKEHLTIAFGNEGSDFIRRHRDQPWFLYLAFNAPHAPNEPTPERLARFSHIKDEERRSYAAQVSLLDDAVGETLEALKQTDQQHRTLIFFLSDNGAPFSKSNGGIGPNGGSNAPLRDGKHSVYEGGIRVPFVVTWPERIPADKKYNGTVSSLDIFATSLAAAGVPMPQDKIHDGVDLLPYLTGSRKGSPHQTLFWRLNERHQAAIREHQHKVVVDGTQPDALYDLSQDISEKSNLSSGAPNSLGQMKRSLTNWFRQMGNKLAFPGNEGPEQGWPEME